MRITKSIVRHEAVDQAIAAVGLSVLARAVGRSPSTVCEWWRIPADHVLAVERVTGISRSVLRPDLYPTEP